MDARTPMFPDDLLRRVSAAGVVAVLTVEDADDAVPLASALAAGGIFAIELTLRTPCALEAIRRIRTGAPESLVGAGTVLNRAQLADAHAAGARFGVSPGCNPSTLRAARELGIPFAPGVATPSEVEIAVEHGCRLLKFFPAGPGGGLPYLRTMNAPFDHLGLRYLPLGGISLPQLGEYLASPLIAAVGGSWMAPLEVIRRRDWAAITAAAAAAIEVVQAARR